MQTIGERLEEARKRKGVSIREAAEATKIRGDYLQKFESNQFNIGLTEIYVRGFLRNYGNFLQLSGERLVSDFGALGHAEVRPRQPSRESYGRMELSVSGTAEEREERRANAGGGAESSGGGADGAANAPRPALRPHASGLPPPRMNPALIYKTGLAIAAAVMVLIIIWLLKSWLGGGTAKSVEHPGLAATTSSAPATNAALAPPSDLDSPISLIALQPMWIRVVRKSDSSELFNGQMAEGEHKDFPNVGLVISAPEFQNLQFAFKGTHYSWGPTVKGKMDVWLKPLP